MQLCGTFLNSLMNLLSRLDSHQSTATHPHISRSFAMQTLLLNSRLFYPVHRHLLCEVLTKGRLIYLCSAATKWVMWTESKGPKLFLASLKVTRCQRYGESPNPWEEPLGPLTSPLLEQDQRRHVKYPEMAISFPKVVSYPMRQFSLLGGFKNNYLNAPSFLKYPFSRSYHAEGMTFNFTA